MDNDTCKSSPNLVRPFQRESVSEFLSSLPDFLLTTYPGSLDRRPDFSLGRHGHLLSGMEKPRVYRRDMLFIVIFSKNEIFTNLDTY